MIATLAFLVLSKSARLLGDIRDIEGVEEHAIANASLVLKLLVRFAVAFGLPTEAHRIDAMAKTIFNQVDMKALFVVLVQGLVGIFEHACRHQSPFRKIIASKTP